MENENLSRLIRSIPSRVDRLVFYLCVNRKWWDGEIFPLIKKQMSIERVVRIHGKEEWKARKEEFLHPSLFPVKTAVIFEDINERDALDVFRNERGMKDTVFFYFMTTKPKKNWSKISVVEVRLPEKEILARLCRRQGCMPTTKALDSLVYFWREYDLSEEDIEQFLSNLGKDKIDILDVQVFFEKSEKTLTFGFLDEISKKNVRRAQLHFSRLMQTGTPPALLLNLLARRFRLFYQILECGETQKDLWKESTLNQFEMRKIQGAVRNFTLQEARSVLYQLAEADRLLKTSSVDFEKMMLGILLNISGGDKSRSSAPPNSSESIHKRAR